MSLNPQVKSTLRVRVKFFIILTILLFFIIFIRLVYLQLFLGSELKERSVQNLQRYNYIKAPRGKIYDRSGVLLADTIPAYNLELLSDNRSDAPTILQFLATLFNEDLARLTSEFENYNRHRYSYQNLLVYERLNQKQLSKLASRLHDYPYLNIEIVPERHYHNAELNSHLIGYVREISAEQLKQEETNAYLPGDRIGKNGIEKTFEDYLRGSKGVKSITVKANGHKLSEKVVKKAIKGNDLKLSVDFRLQEVADAAMGNTSGVVVTMNPNNGEILTFLSKPGYDIQAFAGRLSPEVWQSLLNNPEKPLTNRVINGKYPPGSIFKAFTAYGGLVEKLIDQGTQVQCNGAYYLNNKTRFNCHKRGGHGPVDLVHALAGSCNVYFYQLGVNLGIDRIHSYASMFGMGKKTGINLPDESRGLVPSREWKKTAFKNKQDQTWYPGETPSVAIGQGALSLTPLQLLTSFSALMSNGIIWQPTLVANDSINPRIKEQLDLNPEYQKLIRDGLFAVVNSSFGTAKRAKLANPEILLAGKTATAQIKSSKNLKGLDSENHAMFIGAAPYDRPEIVIFVLIEHGGHGGVTAAPVAKLVLDKFFDLRERNEI